MSTRRSSTTTTTADTSKTGASGATQAATGAGTITTKVKVEQGGRIVIPAAFRQCLGIKPGDTVLVTLEEPDTISIRSYRGAVRRIQELVRQYVPADRSLADELIQERRAEAARE